MQEPRFHGGRDRPGAAEEAGPPLVVAVGGFDPTGGAGLVRDFLTAEALGARAVLVGTAWTRQDESGVKGVELRSSDAVRESLAEALAACPTGQTAVKVGMVAGASIVAAIVAGLDAWPGPVVFDPVLGASAGGSLFAGAPADLFPLLRRATLVTPNLAEAAWITGGAVETLDHARQAAQEMAGRGLRAVLVKGGHLSGPATDVLRSQTGERLFQGARLPGRSPRGTGCALATAIAVGLARGQQLEQSLEEAKAWLAERIQSAVGIGSARFL